jgi:hypothetical protein
MPHCGGAAQAYLPQAGPGHVSRPMGVPVVA